MRVLLPDWHLFSSLSPAAIILGVDVFALAGLDVMLEVASRISRRGGWAA